MTKNKIIKKSNGKEYRYNEYGFTMNSRIVTKSGKINEKMKERVVEAMKDRGASNYQIDLFEATVELRAKQKRPMRASYAFSRGGDRSKRERYIINAGWSVEELADEIGVKEEDLLNEDNWKEDYFSVDEARWLFEFRYNGPIMRRL